MSSPIPQSPSDIIRAILDPLSEKTAELLKPRGIKPTDRLDIQMSDDNLHFVVRPYARLDSVAVRPSFNAESKWFEALPEKKNLKNGTWLVAATDINALVINANWTNEQLEFDDASRVKYVFLLSRFMSQTMQSQHRALYKINKQMPPLPPDWLEHPDAPLADFQKVGAICSVGQTVSMLLCEQGTGKTCQAIQDICMEARRLYLTEKDEHKSEGRKRQMYRVLIVAPKNVRGNWVREFEKFAVTAGKVSVMKGGELERTKVVLDTITVDDEDSEYAVCVCSYQGYCRSWDLIRMVHWHKIILDESHYIKSRLTARWKIMKDAHLISDARQVLTGTPVTNTFMDLFTQLEFLEPGMSGFTSYEKFKEFYGTWERTGQFEKLLGYQNLPFLKERLARIAYIITKKEAMPDLPEKLYSVREVYMGKKQYDWYIKLQEQLALEIEEGLKQKTLTAANVLVKLLRLAQITSGFVCWDAQQDATSTHLLDKELEFLDPIPKLECLLEIIKETDEKEKLIVWCQFRPDIKVIMERLKKEGIPACEYHGGTTDDDRAKAEYDFNCRPASEMKVFVGNPAAGGTGINLRGYDPDKEGTPEDHGCNCTKVVYYSQGWSAVYRSQSEDRAHRRGTRVPVEYIDICVPGTIDEEIRTRVVKKRIDAKDIQDVRDIMKRVIEALPEMDDE